MLELKKVSKFYYNKGIITAGFRKVDLKLDIGELVAITGESGSGKSTLINVISGLDSYEEGEMLVNTEKTSHYTRKEFEEYRKKYVSNIYQDFNLVNSYTVYQNVELGLMLNGYKSKETKLKVKETIRKVGLAKYKNTKVSKLSGGQKQRVAIARALVKDSPIIIADEPTGNIDSKSAKSIMKLLSELSKERLVIVVTHNFEQIEEYATRRIKMHDGRIIEDMKLKDTEEVFLKRLSKSKEISFLNRIRIGTRNTFNILPKFLLLFVIYAFITLSVTSEFSSFLKGQEEQKNSFTNDYFDNLDKERIIIKKKDKTAFTEEEFNKISSIANVENIVKDDETLDTKIAVDLNNTTVDTRVADIKSLKNKIEMGRMPENKNEVVLATFKGDWLIEYQKEDILDNAGYLKSRSDSNLYDEKVTVVGIIYEDDLAEKYDRKIYADSSIIDEINLRNNYVYSKIETFFQDKEVESFGAIVPNANVPRGYVYVPSMYNELVEKGKTVGKKVQVEITNIYFKENKEFEIKEVYDKNNYTKVTGINSFSEDKTDLYINNDEYREMFSKGYFQSSVFLKKNLTEEETAKVLNELKNMNLDTLCVKDTLVDTQEEMHLLTKVFNIVVLLFVFIGVFFISYFLIKIVFKSRNVYYATLRMLGASKKVIKQLLQIELFIIQNITYFSLVIFILLTKNNIIKLDYIKELSKYIKFKDYIILYVVLIVLSYLITAKYSKELYKKTAISTYGEEV